MKLMNGVARSCDPYVEPELLLKFVGEKCQEVIRGNRTELPPIWVGLALSAVAHDEEFHAHFKEVIASSSGKSKDLIWAFEGVFGRLQAGHSSEPSETEPDEPICERILRYTFREGKRMLASRQYEFIKVFEFLTWAGLECFLFRLYQFQAIRQSFSDDPENLIRKGVEIIRATVYSPRNEN